MPELIKEVFCCIKSGISGFFSFNKSVTNCSNKPTCLAISRVLDLLITCLSKKNNNNINL